MSWFSFLTAQKIPQLPSALGDITALGAICTSLVASESDVLMILEPGRCGISSTGRSWSTTLICWQSIWQGIDSREISCTPQQWITSSGSLHTLRVVASQAEQDMGKTSGR